MVPPFLNGRAVFAHKHALALAHASEGGKRNGGGKVAVRPAEGRRKRTPGAARSFFHRLVARQEQGSSERSGYLVRREALELLFGELRGVPAGMGRGRRRHHRRLKRREGPPSLISQWLLPFAFSVSRSCGKFFHGAENLSAREFLPRPNFETAQVMKDPFSCIRKEDLCDSRGKKP